MKEIGYNILIKDEAGNVKDIRRKIVTLKTRGVLSPSHGKDKNKPIVVSLKHGDLIELKPLHSRKIRYTVSVFDVYSFAVRRYAQAQLLEKARAKKAKKAEVRERRALDRMEKRLRNAEA